MHDNNASEWYTNKELFEQMQELSKDIYNVRQEINNVSQEMNETKLLIQQYNGLRKDIDVLDSRIMHCKDASREELKEIKKKLQATENRIMEMNTSIKTLRWVAAATISLIGAIATIAKFFY